MIPRVTETAQVRLDQNALMYDIKNHVPFLDLSDKHVVERDSFSNMFFQLLTKRGFHTVCHVINHVSFLGFITEINNCKFF